MKFDLKNIGPIKEASIKVDGLTVIAGENSIGKSAIGKAIFCLMKGIYQSRNNDFKSFVSSIQKLNVHKDLFEDMFSLKIGNIPLDLTLSELASIESKFHHESTIEELLRKTEITKKIFSKANVFKIENEDIGQYSVRDLLITSFDEVEKSLRTPRSRKQVLIDKYNQLIDDVFFGEIQNKNYSAKISNIIVNNNTEKCEIEIFNNKIVRVNDDYQKLIKNVTIVESPIILSLYRFLRDKLAFNNVETTNYQNLPYYVFDLLKKISNKNYNNQEYVNKEIQRIIFGNIGYSTNDDDFIFTDFNKKKHNIINVASGIKSFGILQLLEKSGNLNEEALLIIDEPEVHLHPFWQVEYAKVLVRLVENNIPVIIASHSPYFIEALKTYSDKTIKDKTNFYLGEMQEGGSVFKDVTNDLEPIFELLAIPMQQLMLENH